MSSSLSKIHVTNSTGLSLNERFTAITTQPKVHNNVVNVQRSRSRSRSIQRSMPAVVERVSSRANQRLLAQLQRKHKMQAALKLKRRSMRTVGGGSNGNGGGYGRIQRGSVKAFRVGVNGKPFRTNSLSKIATMKADREMLNKRRPLRRSNSSSNLANRLGPRRPAAGGAAQRVAKRNIQRQRGGGGAVGGGRRGRLLARDSGGANGRSAGLNNRGRSRSRSRTRNPFLANNGRNGSRTPIGYNQNINNRSRSRSRNRNDVNPQANNNNIRRGRSRSRGRGGAVVDKSALPIKARLGVRPGTNNVRPGGNRGGAQNNRRPNDNRRNASLTRRGIQSGRVQKRRNSTNQNVNRAAVNDNGRSRVRSRSAVRNNANNVGGVRPRPRSRSRTRKGQVGQQRQQGSGQPRQQQQRNSNNNRAPRGRSQQRRGGNNNNVVRRVGRGSNKNGKAQTQQSRGRSRSRIGRGRTNSVPRNQGNKPAAKNSLNKDDLDKELDQYMATTKNENDMDFLLKN